MLYCCSKYYSNTEKRYLLDSDTKHNQVLEWGICPRCNVLKACLTYTDNLGIRKEEKPRKRKAQKFIDECLSQPYYELKDIKLKHGTKNNVFWRYSHQGIKKDFNNVSYGKIETKVNIYSQADFISQAPLTGVFS